MRKSDAQASLACSLFCIYFVSVFTFILYIRRLGYTPTLELLAFAALQILQSALQIFQGALQIFQGALQN